jgi:uncharacterized membrane protein YcaP (DUF421 family)
MNDLESRRVSARYQQGRLPHRTPAAGPAEAAEGIATEMEHEMNDFMFASVETLGRTLAAAVLAYVAAIVLLRVSGKRTLSKWNAFDFVVTIALGSSLATMILSNQTSIAQGVVALAALIALQYVVTWLSVRAQAVQRAVKATPQVLLYHGRFIEEALKRERVTQEEIRATLRAHGIASVEGVGAVVLETDGSMSVVADLAPGKSSAMQDVRGP